MTETELLTNAEAAIYLRVSTKTLERMRNRGTGPAYLQGEGSRAHVYYPIDELKAWLASGLHGTRRVHGFATNLAGAIIAPAIDLKADNVIVGSLFELLTEETWADAATFDGAYQAFQDEQAEESAAVDEAKRRFERDVLSKLAEPGQRISGKNTAL